MACTALVSEKKIISNQELDNLKDYVFHQDHGNETKLEDGAK